MQNPAPLIWNDSLMTGVPEIDEQHRILVHTFNEASEKLCGESAPEVLEAITQDLLSYALYHFETEELLMRDAGYESEDGADARRHRAEHRDFSTQVLGLRDRIKADIPVAAARIAGFSAQLAGDAHHAHRHAARRLHPGKALQPKLTTSSAAPR
ncbi:MAG: hemerythrin family protein [Zoogloea sp.]|nr:hemerythrin family protein [Zoogloea sp.]